MEITVACFIATGNETIGRFNSFVRNGCGEIMAVKTRKPGGMLDETWKKFERVVSGRIIG